MINVSDEFKTAMKEPIKELQAQVIAGDTIILSQDNLVSFTISVECGI